MIEIYQKEFEQLSCFVKSHYGINLTEKKKALVMGRLQNVLNENSFKSFAEYYDYIVSDKTGEAVVTLIDKITTNHTYFMRETDHFFYFRDKVLPCLIKTIKNRDLRIWSAGCSTGEEPYTLAMLLDEFLGTDKKLWDSKILATDISSKVLDTAVKGIYGDEEISPLPAGWRLNYFNKLGDGNSKLTDRIKNEVIYRRFNLMDEEFPFKRKFHVIFCRNVMIYFDNKTKHDLVNKFFNIMEDGGYLFIGHSESLNRNETPFKYVMPAVYRKD